MPALFVDDEALRAKLISTAQRMTTEKLVVNQSGNVSCRAWSRSGTEGMLVTPSGFPYDAMKPRHLVWMPLSSRDPLSEAVGELAPSSEWELHREIYLARSDVQAAVHTHSLYATTLSIAEIEIPAVHYMIAAAGTDRIPCAPYALFGTRELALSTVKALGGANAALMSHHGLVAVGPTLDKAFSIAVEIENLAHQYILLRSMGCVDVLSPERMQAVFEQFKGYGQAKKRR